jgi:hypothetical protein
VVGVLGCKLVVGSKYDFKSDSWQNSYHSVPVLGKLDHWRSVLTSWTTVRPCVRMPMVNSTSYPPGTTHEKQCMGLLYQWANASKLKANGAEKATAISCSFPIRYINKSASSSSQDGAKVAEVG